MTPKRQRRSSDIDDLQDALKVLKERDIHLLSKDEVIVLQRIAQRIHGMSPTEQEAVHEVLKKASTLGDIVLAFEALQGFMNTTTFMRNIAWLVLPIVIFMMTVSNRDGVVWRIIGRLFGQ